MGFQQLGVIPFEIRNLKKRYTEKWRAQSFYIAAIVRHRGTVGAWRNRGWHLRDIVFYAFTSVFSPSLCAFYMQ